MHQTDIANSRTKAELANRGSAHIKFSWATLVLFYGIGLVRCVDWFIIGALLTPIKNELHLPDEQLDRRCLFCRLQFYQPDFRLSRGSLSAQTVNVSGTQRLERRRCRVRANLFPGHSPDLAGAGRTGPRLL